MDKGWTATVEVAQSLSYLTKNVDFVGNNKVFFGLFLQKVSKACVHFLQDQHGDTRGWREVHAEELDDMRMDQFGPRHAFLLEIINESLGSAGRVIFEEDFVELLSCTRGTDPVDFFYSGVRSLPENLPR